jgi:hypothetical protein
MMGHPAELSSPSDAATLPSIVGVATSFAVFQTWASSPLKSYSSITGHGHCISKGNDNIG